MRSDNRIAPVRSLVSKGYFGRPFSQRGRVPPRGNFIGWPAMPIGHPSQRPYKSLKSDGSVARVFSTVLVSALFAIGVRRLDDC